MTPISALRLHVSRRFMSRVIGDTANTMRSMDLTEQRETKSRPQCGSEYSTNRIQKMKHGDQVVALLQTQIRNEAEVDDIRQTADEVAAKWVKPLSGGKEETNGLIYGLVQSGKTGVLTVTAAMGADEGYRTLIILT